MKILGIDFGLSKIGLATAEGKLAEPFSVIKHHPQVVKEIAALCQKQGIEKIVLGIPEGEIAKKAQCFGEKLAKTTGLPLVYQDETLTSKEAVAKMIEVGRKRKFRQEKEDAFAAAIILQNYLDREAKKAKSV